MKVLVLGGTRFFGREVVLTLVRQGHEVTVLTRGRVESPPGVRHVQGDRNEPSVLQAAARDGYDAVFDNIAYNAEHVRHALDVFAGRVGHYVFTSSAVVYLPTLRPPYFEAGAPELPPEPPPGDQSWWPYTKGKIEAERELYAQQRVPFTIVRPPVVIGPNDPTLRLHFYVQRVLDGGPLLLIDGGKHCFHLADSLDLAGAYVRILQSGQRTHGKAYNVCQRDVLTLEELVSEVARALGRELRTVAVPSAVLQRHSIDYDESLGPFEHPLIMPPTLAIADGLLDPKPILQSVAESSRWHAENTMKDSAHYERRKQEIELAGRFESLAEGLRVP